MKASVNSRPRAGVDWVRGNEFLRRLAARGAGCLPYRMRENLRQWLLRSVHEPDFRLFDELRDCPGLVLDIGANRGAAALSVLSRTRKLEVLSLEPNPDLRWSLGFVRLLYPKRFRFRIAAASEQNTVGMLSIPIGIRDYSAQASMDREEYEKDYVIERLRTDGHRGNDADFRSVRIETRRMDDLGVHPDIVKIDVEGWESQVLQGMRRILRELRPALIIELNNRERWAPTLGSIGYRFYSFDRDGFVRHEHWQGVPGLNVICLHPCSRSALARRLWNAAVLQDAAASRGANVRE